MLRNKILMKMFVRLFILSIRMFLFDVSILCMFWSGPWIEFALGTLRTWLLFCSAFGSGFSWLWRISPIHVLINCFRDESTEDHCHLLKLSTVPGFFFLEQSTFWLDLIIAGHLRRYFINWFRSVACWFPGAQPSIQHCLYWIIKFWGLAQHSVMPLFWVDWHFFLIRASLTSLTTFIDPCVALFDLSFKFILQLITSQF
jgi:hypothetical protein